MYELFVYCDMILGISRTFNQTSHWLPHFKLILDTFLSNESKNHTVFSLHHCRAA